MFLYFLILMCFSTIVLAGNKYNIILLSAEKCASPKGSVDRSEPLIYEVAAKQLNSQTSVIRTDFSILRPIGPILMTLRIYQLKTKPKLVFQLERLDCHNPFSYQLLRVVNLKLDDDCIAAPGNYSTNNINLQDFAWVASKAMVAPGKYVYEMEFLTAKSGIVLCNTITCEIKTKLRGH